MRRVLGWLLPVWSGPDPCAVGRGPCVDLKSGRQAGQRGGETERRIISISSL
jgi:hypothetical protein